MGHGEEGGLHQKMPQKIVLGWVKIPFYIAQFHPKKLGMGPGEESRVGAPPLYPHYAHVWTRSWLANGCGIEPCKCPVINDGQQSPPNGNPATAACEVSSHPAFQDQNFRKLFARDSIDQVL
jgi:hypothetical protein